MTAQQKQEKLKQLLEKKPSSFLNKLDAFKKNKKWLDYSSSIATHVLESLRHKNWTQKKLAEELNISPQQINKIVKGGENLTLETISKLETVLNIELIRTLDFIYTEQIKISVSELHVPRTSKQDYDKFLYDACFYKRTEKKREALNLKFDYSVDYVESKENCESLSAA